MKYIHWHWFYEAKFIMKCSKSTNNSVIEFLETFCYIKSIFCCIIRICVSEHISTCGIWFWYVQGQYNQHSYSATFILESIVFKIYSLYTIFTRDTQWHSVADYAFKNLCFFHHPHKLNNCLICENHDSPVTLSHKVYML